MNRFPLTFLSGTSLLSLGVGLFFIGIVVWTLPVRFQQMLAMRDSKAARLRAAGEEERASRIEEESRIFMGRVPAYGRALVAAGTIVTIIGALRLD